MFLTGTAPLSPARLAAADEYLAAATADLFAHDERLRSLDVQVRFDRGVAHLTGAVGGQKELRLARETVGRLAGVLAVWSRVRVAGRTPVILDIGCGTTTQYPENVGVDVRASPAVAVRADLRRGLPFADASVDAVFAVHVLEHLVDYLPLLAECHRVLRRDGVLYLLSPWWRFVNAVADPTHVRLLDVQTVKGICEQPGCRWYPLHAGCDGASVFADLTPISTDDPGPHPSHLARFFD